MNINRINTTRVTEVYNKNANKSNKVLKGNVKSKDNVELSQSGKIFSVALQAVMDQPDINIEKINEIKNLIKSGNYKVNDEELAKRIVDNSFHIIK